MKTLLLTLLLIASAAQADQWIVNGRTTYNGTLHRFSVDRTMVYVTSDRDNYKGSWLKVASLDPATRVRIRAATPQEQAAVQAQAEQNRQLEAQALAQAEQNRQMDVQALAQIQREQGRLLQAQAQAPANSAYAASLQVQYQSQLSSRTYSPIYPQRYSHHRYYNYGYSNYGYYNYGYSNYRYSPYGYSHYGYPHNGHHHHYSSYYHTPYVHIPHVYAPRPIFIRNY